MKRCPMRKLSAMTLAAILAGASITASAAPKGPGTPHTMQCWTDETGARACGDRVPPKYAQQQLDVLNAQGVVTNSKARKRTADEVVADEKKEADAAAEKRRLSEQTAYDRYLLQTFQSVTQMQAVRDNRVQTLDGRLALAEKSVTESEKTLQGLRDRATAKPNDVRLKKQVKEYETSLVDTLKAVAQMKKDRDDTNKKFDSDVARYKKLRSGEIQIGAQWQPDAPAAPAADAATAQ